MGLDGIGAVEIGPRPGSAADGFVILIGFVAEGEIVHAALGGGQNPQSPVKGIGYELRSFHVAGDHGGGIAGVQHGTFGDDDVERFQAPPGERNVVVDQRPEDVKHRRLADGGRGVEVVRRLLRRAGEIDLGAPGFGLDGNLHLDPGAVVHV